MVSQMAEIKVVGRGIGGVVDFHGFQSPIGHHLDIFLKGVFAELIEHRMGENRDSVSLYDEFVGKGEDVRDVNEISLLMVMLRKDEILSESKNWEIMYNGKFMQ